MGEKKKHKGGRPKKSPADSRSKPVSVYLTPSEHEELERMCEPFGTSKSEMIGRLLRGQRGQIHEPMTDEHKAFATSLTKLGANINQCALRLNDMARSVESAEDVQRVLVMLQHYADRAHEDVQEVVPLIHQLKDILFQRTKKK